MNSNRHFDKHIKDQFSNYTPDVHPRIWENIIAEKDKKRPAGFWISMFSNRNKLLLLGLIIALSSGGAWLYYNTALTAKKDITLNDAESKHQKSKPGTSSDTDAPAIMEPAVDLKLNPGNTEAAGTLPVSDDITANTNPFLSSEGNTRASIKSPLPENDGATAPPARDNKKYYTGLGNILVNTIAPALEEDEYLEPGGTLLGRLTYNAEKYTEKRRTGKKQEPLHFKPVVFLPDCPIEKDASGNKKYLEFYAGPDYAFQHLQDTANSAYLQKRKESTSFKSAFSAGVRYTKVFNNSMSIRGGVNFSQINEKFSFNQGNIVQVTYIINANGDTVGSYTTTGSRYKTTINRYRSIDIPLMIGYELGNGKLHANINAGPVINIYSWQKGDVLDASGNPVSITTGKSSSPYQFKTNAGIGFMGAVSVYYKLNNRLHIMAEPYFRYNLSQMNKENITLKQKYQTAGLRLGIRLDLK
ncbi:MAG: hypothetical protein WAT20_08465 [Ferruginibacter sp.]|nr:hypothetical protein [Chitinophagaceae bacterium]